VRVAPARRHRSPQTLSAEARCGGRRRTPTPASEIGWRRAGGTRSISRC